jgi:hypothetical protein
MTSPAGDPSGGRSAGQHSVTVTPNLEGRPRPAAAAEAQPVGTAAAEQVAAQELAPTRRRSRGSSTNTVTGTRSRSCVLGR